MRDKFTDLGTTINENVDIASIAETKLNASFPYAQFILLRYHTPHRQDINNKSGSILKHARSTYTLPFLRRVM